jgi:hypothetical protein
LESCVLVHCRDRSNYFDTQATQHGKRTVERLESLACFDPGQSTPVETQPELFDDLLLRELPLDAGVTYDSSKVRAGPHLVDLCAHINTLSSRRLMCCYQHDPSLDDYVLISARKFGARHPVPLVVSAGSDATTQRIVTEALPGDYTVGDTWRARRPEAIKAIATGLRAIHAIPIDDFRRTPSSHPLGNGSGTSTSATSEWATDGPTLRLRQ